LRPTPRTLLHIVVSVLLAAPFFLFRDIPLFDMPIHIAQEHILFDPALAGARQYYIYDWRLFPNMALDVMVYLLHLVLPLDLAIKVFLGIIVLQLYWGVQAIARALQAPGRSFGLAAALFVYNGPLLMGFVDLCFGIGMALWVFALWLEYGRRPLAAIPFAILPSLILLAHLFAFAIYTLCIGCYAAGRLVVALRARDWRTVLAVCLSLLPLLAPLLLYRFAIAHDTAESLIVFSDIQHKSWALLTLPGISDLVFNIVFLALLAIVLIVILRRMDIAKTMLPVLGGLLIAFIALPYQVALGTWVDYRVPTILVLCLIASLRWRVARAALRPAEFAILLLFLIRMGLLYSEWWQWQPVYDDYRAAFQLLPIGAKLLPIGTHPDALQPAEHPPLAHIDAFAVTERGAFVPTMLAGLPYQMLHYAPNVHPLQQSFSHGAAVPTDYDYVLIVKPTAENTPPNIETIFFGHDFLLARILK
jgi:hypothetical protein